MLHLWSAHDEPVRDLRFRFDVLSGALRAAMDLLGVPDTRVGAVAGEYCDGAWSANAGGHAKLAGTGQRLSKHGWMWSAVLTFAQPDRVREVLAHCYRELALDLDPATVGSVSDHVPGVTYHEVSKTVIAALSRAVAQHGLLLAG